jgi:hypothetical protein
LVINQPSDPRTVSVVTKIPLVVGEKYSITQSSIACIDPADFEQFASLARPDDATKLARLRLERIAQFRCLDLIKGNYVTSRCVKARPGVLAI